MSWFPIARKEPQYDFATFDCVQCGERQARIVRIGNKTIRCGVCNALHRIAPSERTEKPKKAG